MISFAFTPIDLTELYKDQYKLGWISQNDLKSYVTLSFITPDQYLRITGDSYETQN